MERSLGVQLWKVGYDNWWWVGISIGLRSCLSWGFAVPCVDLSSANTIVVINGMKLPLCVVMYNPSYG
jgi:hypothetical protein